MFLVLPEHVSNAHHIWNCALFITQLSNLESSSTKHVYQQQQQQKTDAFKLNNYLKMIANSSNSFNNRKSDDDYLDYSHKSSKFSQTCHIEEKLSSVCHDNLKSLNEPIMKIFKIKKRNKASLYNLILPFSSQNGASDYTHYHDSNANILNDIFNYKLFSNNGTTTPWMQLVVPPTPQASGTQTQTSLESNKTLRLEDEEFNDVEDFNDTEELELENNGKLEESAANGSDKKDSDSVNSSSASSSSRSSSNENEDCKIGDTSNDVSSLDYDEGCKR
jgi:hypothetical protein